MKDQGSIHRLIRATCLLSVAGCVAGEARAAPTVFSYTGSDQTWSVPAGVTQITVKAWGAGGSGGNYIFNDIGGGGGFVTGALTVTPGQQLTIIVGGGGQPGSGAGAYGGGGGKACGIGGRGGGRSAVRDASGTELITAGAGGGGGGSATATEARGGGGGGLSGTASNWPGYDGDPGTQSAGGAGYQAGQAGAQFAGGYAGCGDNGYNGSGGSGYYGGGGGSDLGDGGGGGGSSLVPTGGSTASASDDVPGNSSDRDYGDNAGHGGAKSFPGYPGRVVIIFQDQDDDGVPDSVDACPNSDLNRTVVIDSCDSGVANPVLPTGCTISDFSLACAASAGSHLQFESCVSRKNNQLKNAGVLSSAQKSAIQSCANQAHIP